MGFYFLKFCRLVLESWSCFIVCYVFLVKRFKGWFWMVGDCYWGYVVGESEYNIRVFLGFYYVLVGKYLRSRIVGFGVERM